MALSRRTGQRFQASIWPGFVDAMTALLLVLMFVLTIFMVMQSVLRDTITGQETELDQLSSQVLSLAQALGLERQNVADLEGQVTRLDSTLDDAQQQADAQAALIASLTLQSQAQTLALADRAAQITSFEAQVASLLAARDQALGEGVALSTALSESEAQNQRLIGEQEALQLALAQARDEIDAQIEQARLAAAQADALEALIADLHSQNAAIDLSLTAALSRLETETSRGDGLERQLSETETARQVEQSEAAATLAQALSSLEAALAKTAALDQDLSELDAARLAALAEAGQTDALLAAALSRLEAATLSGEKLAAQLSDVEAARLIENAAAQALQQELSGIETSLTGEEAARLAEAAAAQALRLRLNEVETSLSAEEAARLAEAAAAEALRARLAEVENALSAEEAARLADAAAAQALRERLKNADDELTAMTLALEERRREAEETLTLLAAANASQEDLNSRLISALLATETASGKASEADARIAELEQKLAAANVDQDDLNSRLLAALLAGDTQSTAASDAQARAAGLELQLAAALLAQTSAEETAVSEADARALLEQRLAAALAERDAAQVAVSSGELSQSDLQKELAAAVLAKSLAASQLASSDKALEQVTAEVEALRIKENLASQLQDQLSAALAAKILAERSAALNLSDADQKAILLATAQKSLSEQEAKNAAEQRKLALLNEQVAALRSQLGSLQALLDTAAAQDAASNVQIQALGSQLNTALARVAAEEKRRRVLEETERLRLEQEQERLLAENLDLEKYRSDFFGQLRDLLGTQAGVQIVGDRFVFSSEVLFEPGSAELSAGGKGDIAQVAEILRGVASEIPAGIDWVIQVDGHTDNTPLGGQGKYVDNWELSQGRALSVVRFMADDLRIPPVRLSANGFGEFQPLNPADTDEARAQNRRIELKFTEK